MSITRDVTLQILAFLFPPVCLACGEVEGIESLPLGLCSRCRRQLETTRHSRGPYGQRTSGSALDGWVSGWSYEPPFDAVIHGLKFGRLEFLGQDLADGLHRLIGDVERNIDVVVPIPLHWHRRLTRGYNQAEAIAKPLARQLGLPLVHALRRQRRTRPQARLNRVERETNLRLAFAPRNSQCARIAGQRLLLVDDVITTGATLEVAARCLRSQGARSVLGLTAGRTPVPGRSRDVENFDKELLNSL